MPQNSRAQKLIKTRDTYNALPIPSLDTSKEMLKNTLPMTPATKPKEETTSPKLSGSNIPLPSMENQRKSSITDLPVLQQSRIKKVIRLQDDFNNGAS